MSVPVAAVELVDGLPGSVKTVHRDLASSELLLPFVEARSQRSFISVLQISQPKIGFVAVFGELLTPTIKQLSFWLVSLPTPKPTSGHGLLHSPQVQGIGIVANNTLTVLNVWCSGLVTGLAMLGYVRVASSRQLLRHTCNMLHNTAV